MSLSRQLQTRLTLSGTAAALLTAVVLTAMALNGSTQGLVMAAVVLVLLSALLSWLLARQWLQPLAAVEAGMQQLQEEHKQLVEQRDDARTHLDEMEKTLARVGLEDALTGLANRRQFERGLLEEFNRAARTNLSLAIIMIDIDLFDEYNASYGR
jgi:predicted signal transduction protein with EAL and GGDEF domain